MKRYGWVAWVALMVSGSALGEFVGGVDHFDGTVPDTLTWELYEMAQTPVDRHEFSQSDLIRLDGFDYSPRWMGRARYNTKTLTVGVGKCVWAKVTCNETMDNYGLFGLSLTNKSNAGYDAYTDSAYVYIWNISAGWGNHIAAGQSPFGGPQYAITTSQHPTGATYIYAIARTSSTSATCSVYEENGTTLVGTPQTLTLTGIPDNLYICLYTLQGDASFEDVRIMNVGDPPPVLADDPTFSPDGGAGPATVTITAAGATTIRYTTDGSYPSETNGTVIASGGTVPVSRSLILRAKAWAGAESSGTKSATYLLPYGFPDGIEGFDGTVLDTATWSAFPNAGVMAQNDALTINGGTGYSDYTTKLIPVNVGQAVSVEVTPFSAATSGGPILGLTNDSAGTTNSTFSDSQFYGILWFNSWDATQTYGSYGIPNTMIVSGDHPFNETRIYRIDRTGNTEAKFTIYSAAGTELGSATLTGLPAFTAGPYVSLFTSQTVVTFDNLRILNAGEEPVAPVTFSPGPGVYDTAQSVTLSTLTSGATIHYTTDGSNPDEGSDVYTVPLSLTTTTTLKARAYAGSLLPSIVRTAQYMVATGLPSFSPDGGMYAAEVDVTIGCSTSGATIRYTTDGSDPTESSPEYTAPVHITQNLTLKAKAWSGSLDPSPIKSTEYLIPRPAQIPCGTATVDGDLSDWDGASWTPLDQPYDGNPSDIPEAYYAARWTPTKVYMAVKVRDTAHMFTDTYGGVQGWNDRDAVSLYIHTTGTGGTGYMTNQDIAQSYSVGITNTDRTSVWTAAGSAADLLGTEGFVAAGRESGEWLYYEVAMTPFELFGDRISQPSVLSTLAANGILGLDVCAGGHNGTAYTGTKSENLLRGKYDDWTKFAIHKLAAFTATDLAAVLAAMDSTATGGGAWNPAADLDDDGEVTSTDLSIVLANME